MKNIKFYIFIWLPFLAIVSCRKNSVEFIPLNTVTIIESDTIWDNNLLAKSNLSTAILPFQGIENLVNQLSIQPKFDSCSAEQGGSVISAPDNVTVTIPPNACLNAQNRLCTGKIEIEITVLRKKGDFIAFNLPSSSGSKQLISGGVVIVKARQNGQEVKLATGKTLKIRYLMTDVEGLMQVFDPKINGRFGFDWVLPTMQGVVRSSVTPVVFDSLQRKGYDMVVDRFGIFNCAKFAPEAAVFNTKLAVYLPQTFTNLNTSVYAVFKDSNSTIRLTGDAPTRSFVPIGSGLPVGKTVTLVSVSYIKDKFYFAQQEITIQSNPINAAAQPVRLIPAVIEKETLKETLKNL